MAVHLVALVAMHLTRGGGSTTHLVSTLVWPYLVRVCLNLRGANQDLLTSSTLFLFQLSQIFTANHDHHPNSDLNLTANNNNSRWDRALRLVRQRVAVTRGWNNNPPTFAQHHEESLRLLSDLAL